MGVVVLVVSLSVTATLSPPCLSRRHSQVLALVHLSRALGS